MIHAMKSSCKLTTITLLSLSLLANSFAYADSVSGKWQWTIETPDGNSFKSVMTAKQEGSKLTGTLSRPESEDKLELLNGKVEGDKVSFKVIPTFDGNKITVEYSGTLKGDKIDGGLRVVEFDAELEWHASRVVENMNPSGVWDWSLSTPNGDTMEATLELFLKNEKLSGELVADAWAMELEDTKISGNKISFRTTNANNDQKYLSKGTITGKKIAGTVAFTNGDGEEVSLEWSAKKSK
jgi:hypothetical protein